MTDGGGPVQDSRTGCCLLRIVMMRSSDCGRACSDEKEAALSYLDRIWCPLFAAEVFCARAVREVGKIDV